MNIIKYITAVSVILNAILIATVIGLLPFLFYMSLLAIVFLIWYIMTLVDRVEDINDDVEEIFEIFDSFEEHLHSIYGMQMFYGDETLESLINHSRDVLYDLNNYRQKYYLDSDIVDEDEEDYGETSQETTDEN